MPPDSGRDGRDSDNPNDWIQEAEDALVVARLSSSVIPAKQRRICAHQAAEYALKALFAARGMKHPQTHSLENLLKILRNDGVEIPAEVDKVKDLKLDRYPKREAAPIRHDAAEAAEKAQVALDWAKMEIIRTRPGAR